MTKRKKRESFGSMRVFGLLLIVAALSGCASAPKGSFAKPVSGTITSSYGPRGGGYHRGVDIGAKRGTLVRAANDGRVVFRGRRKGFGRLVIIDHGGGMQTYYAHLSGYKVRKGKRVRRGAPVGKVGSSGKASGPHLHFELRVDGKPVNPAGVVPLR